MCCIVKLTLPTECFIMQLLWINSPVRQCTIFVISLFSDSKSPCCCPHFLLSLSIILSSTFSLFPFPPPLSSHLHPPSPPLFSFLSPSLPPSLPPSLQRQQRRVSEENSIFFDILQKALPPPPVEDIEEPVIEDGALADGSSLSNHVISNGIESGPGKK